VSYGTCNACGSDDCEGYDACTIRSLRAEVERLRDLFAAEQKATHAALTRDADQIERLKAERDAARAEVERLHEARVQRDGWQELAERLLTPQRQREPQRKAAGR